MRTPATIALALSLQLTGCAVVPSLNDSPGYGAIVYDFRTDPNPYTLLEHGNQKSLYAATAAVYFYSWLLPFYPVDASGTGETLFDHPIAPWEFWAAYEMREGSRTRGVGAIESLAMAVSPTPFWIGDVRQTSTQKRWILGNDPLIVALGSDTIPLEPNARTHALPRAADLDHTATELLILDHWPPAWRNTGSEWEKTFAAEIAKTTRHIKLDHPTPLRDLLIHQP